MLFPELERPARDAPEPPMVELLTRFYAWVLSGACKIRNKKGKIIPLVPNKSQQDTHKAMLAQALRGKPIRIIRLKSRKVGVSTWIQALQYWLTKELPFMTATTVAHSADANKEIFGITKLIKQFDPNPRQSLRSSRREIAYSESHGSTFKTESAGGEYVGSGSTTFFLHISELSKWPAATMVDQLLSLLNSVPAEAETIITIESTANQRDEVGEFERMWIEAEAGRSDYAAVFTPWHDEPDAHRDEPVGERSAYEQTLVERFGLSDRQIAWMRWCTINLCRGNEVMRRQEYPSTPDEAFSVASGKIFPTLSRAKHELSIPIATLRSEWDLYRCVDWGGGHPFVCLWIAHKHGPSRFTADVMNVMSSWEQMHKYVRKLSGQPAKLNDDATDALRYCVTTFNLSGHVHLYRELFVPNSAQEGDSELDLAQRIVEMSGTENILGTVADRSRPNSIVLFNQHGIPTIAAQKPATHRLGEIEDGLEILVAMMNATVNLRPEELLEDPNVARLRRWLEKGQHERRAGLTDSSTELLLALSGQRDREGASEVNPFTGW